MEDINKKLDDVLEIVNFIKDNSVTKQEFNEFRESVDKRFDKVDNEFIKVRGEMSQFREDVNNEFKKVREEIIDHVDAFVGLHQKNEIEIAAVAHKTDRLENHIHKIAKHLQLQLE